MARNGDGAKTAARIFTGAAVLKITSVQCSYSIHFSTPSWSLRAVM